MSRVRLLRLFWPIVLVLLFLAVPALAQGPVGRISEASGAVSLRPTGGGWAVAPRGAALLEGQTVRTGPRGQAELDLGVNRIGMDPGTVLRIDSAHPGTPAVTLEQGRAMLLVRSLQAGQVARVLMARGSVTLAQPGLYVIDVDGAGGAATVGVSRGLAQVYGAGVSLMVAAGQTGVIGGADGRPGSLRAGAADGFLADDASVPALPQVVRPALQPPLPGHVAGPGAGPGAQGPVGQGGGPYDDVVGLPGGEALLRDGSWGSDPAYGQVWYPPVAQGWSPYADRWEDNRAWGYTPWQHGTWIQVGPRWGWLPPPRRYYGPGHVHRQGRPPPAVAQPQRPAPMFVAPQPVGGGGRPPPVVSGPRPAPGFSAPPPAPGFAAPPPVAAPQVNAPRPAPGFAPPPVAAPQVSAPRPAPMFAAPPPVSAPPMAAPRPAPMFASPLPAAFAPRAAAPPPAPSRRCGPMQVPC